MIISFAHKGLENFYYHHSSKGIQPEHRKRVRKILDFMTHATGLDEFPKSYALHRLKGGYKKFYAIKVDGNYRIIFQVTDEGFELLDYLDYH